MNRVMKATSLCTSSVDIALYREALTPPTERCPWKGGGEKLNSKHGRTSAYRVNTCKGKEKHFLSCHINPRRAYAARVTALGL